VVPLQYGVCGVDAREYVDGRCYVRLEIQDRRGGELSGGDICTVSQAVIAL
jgi:hypothetical protein